MNDYGYFGKGISGYVHYNQSFKRNFGSGGSGGGGRRGSGCLTLLIIITVPIIIPFIIKAL